MTTPHSNDTRRELLGGALVLAAAIAGFALANSPVAGWYESLREARIGPAALHLDLTVGQWASDGLLAVFFFLVGLELKREFVEGPLRRVSTAIVPVLAAVGGVIAPALIYLAVNAGGAGASGWAIPTATDIAFAVAVLGLVAPGVPPALRLFLLTLAVVDDLIAIAIIAVWYTARIEPLPLLAALALVAVYALLVRRFAGWYARRAWAAWATLLPLGMAVWACMHASGVHATIAGVLLASVVPVTARKPRGKQMPPRSLRPAEEFARRFAPLSTFIAVPLFAFFAAGVSVGGESRFPADPIAIGIMLGLVLGKPLGIVLTTLALTRFTRAELGPGVRLRELIGVGMLAGVGFTVSLLIAELSFEDAADSDTARLAVLAGSVVAVLSSALLLSYSRRKHP